jgi:O-antigen/teichoic acid export membrane protein
MLLNFDLHPIVIHLSQALVIAIPVISLITNIFPDFQPEVLKNVLIFAVFVFPFTLVMAIITGVIDGLTRFKTLATPLLRVKIIFSIIILSLSIALFFVARDENYNFLTIILSVLSLAAGFQLGLWGKKLINVILPGTYPQKKGSKVARPETGAGKSAEEEK